MLRQSGIQVHSCKYCDELVDYDPASDIWRRRDDGVISCRKNIAKGSYRWTHQPKALVPAGANSYKERG